MVASRIRVAKDKGELLKRLMESSEETAPFPTYADAIIFAATLGFKLGQRVPLGDQIAKEPGPIAWDVFRSRGYEGVIRLLAIATTQNIHMLSSSDPQAISTQTQVLEEYANGGLESLQTELRGVVDITDHLLLLLQKQRHPRQTSTPFDLRRFLP